MGHARARRLDPGDEIGAVACLTCDFRPCSQTAAALALRHLPYGRSLVAAKTIGIGTGVSSLGDSRAIG